MAVTVWGTEVDGTREGSGLSTGLRCPEQSWKFIVKMVNVGLVLDHREQVLFGLCASMLIRHS